MEFITMLFSIFMLSITNQQNSDMLLDSSMMNTEKKWRIVNDGVMGGLSTSEIILDNDKIVFNGNVSLENNGGFASLRSPVKNYNFEKFNGIEIRINGKGKIFSISMKETSYFTGYFFTKSFKTNKDEWTTIQIPFSEFSLKYFGRELESDKKIPLDKIKEISLLIGEKQKGKFSAEIDYIKLY